MTTSKTDIVLRGSAGSPASQGESLSAAARPAENPGLFGLFRLNRQARLIEGATEANLRILTCQLKIIEGQRAVAEADLHARISLAAIQREADLKELDGRRRAAELAQQAEEAETERRLMAAVRQATPDQARRILGADLETQRLLKERDQLRRERLGTSHPLPAPAPPALPAPDDADTGGTAALEVHVSDRQTETLAVRALTRFSSLPPDEADRQWDAWRRELHVRLPPYAAAQVEARADELRQLAG